MPNREVGRNSASTDRLLGELVAEVSIPRPFMWILPISGRCAKPAVVHDYVNSRGVTENTKEQRRWATGIFDRGLKAQGVAFWRRWMMVAFVTVFSFPDQYL